SAPRGSTPSSSPSLRSVAPVGAIGARRLTAGPERTQRCVDEQDAVPRGRAGAPPPAREVAVALAVGPLLPGRDRPEQQRLVVVGHRGHERAGQLPSVPRVQLRRVASPLQHIARRSGRDRHELVRVQLAPHAGGAQLLDAARPRCRHHDPIGAATAEPGRLRPPALERGILRAASDRLGRERRREPRPALVLPHVHRLRPLPGRAEKRPHAVAELLALLLADRAPVRGHVVHVIRAVMPDDVDELVDVDSAVHERYRWVARGDPRYCIHLDIFVQREESAMERLGIEPLSVFGLPPVAFVDLAADLGLRYIAITLTALPNPYGYAPFSL